MSGNNPVYNVIGEATNWYLRSVLFALVTAKSRVVFTVMVYRTFPGSFTLMEMDLSVNLDSDSKLDGYIVLCRTVHIAQTRTRIPTPYFCKGEESESESIRSSPPAM